MQWLNKIVDQLIAGHGEDEILVSSGVSPSGTYHLGTLREILTAEAIYRELRYRGKKAKHIHVVDDLDVFRKVPADVPAIFEKYLGKPLCDVPSPDGKEESYAEYFLRDLLVASEHLNLKAEIIRSHEKYRKGNFTEVIETVLENKDQIRSILSRISGREIEDSWTPIQVVEDGYLKNRQFVSIDIQNKTVTYVDSNDSQQTVSYLHGEVKLSWRVDWPARWWMLGVDAEPFGRDHATKGGSYDTGAAIVREVFKTEPPLPIPYNFINRTGDTKKMSKSAGNTITAADLVKILPPEVVWFFILRYAPDKLLFFDQGETLIRLIDDFSELLAKKDRTDEENQLLRICLEGISSPTVSNVPFSHLVSSYQAALKDANKTIDIISRSEYREIADAQREVIATELRFIDEWLKTAAPEDVVFELRQSVNDSEFDDREKDYFSKLAGKIESSPKDADGEWFHKAIYAFKESDGLEPSLLFGSLYKLLINKQSGPRAGWFLSILPRDWLLNRLRLTA